MEDLGLLSIWFTPPFPGPAQDALMTKKRLIIAGGIIAVPVLALAWWLGSPLFIDSEVDEAFPMSADAVIPEGMTAEEVEAEMEEAAQGPETEVDEDMPEESEPVVLTSG